MFEAFQVDADGKEQKIDMKGVKLQTEDEVRAWLMGPTPGYLVSHPELEGKRIHVRLADN